MAYKDEIQIFLQRLIKLTFISSPLLFFITFQVATGKISGEEYSIFIFLLILSQIMILRYFTKKIEILDRKTTLQMHDNKETKENQFLLMSIMENLSDPLLLLDSNKRILMANQAAYKLLGDHILKQDIALFIKNSLLSAALQRTLETGGSESCEFKFGVKTPKQFLSRIHLFGAQKDNSGISTLSEHEMWLNQTHANKKYLFLALYDISIMKHVDKMRMDFVANASHELRTPLASILGFIETLQGPARTDSEARERFLKIMHDEASRMSRLIEDLLSLSRIERDEHIKPSGSVTLPILIKSVIEALTPQAEAKKMSINLTYGEITNITGDHDQLTQVFQNLIENAIKYGKENTPIEVVCTDEILPGTAISESVNITITNQGPGIAAEHLPRLMERFYRVDSARSRNLGGTGLGLAIVKHIIQRHTGRVFFESKVNAYTKVTISLPK